MNEGINIIFGLTGGLALFLFGMNSMSDALQKAAGEKMKAILGVLTKNPVMGALAGALVTAVLQSSSATTVMVIGFVSAGLMSLPQAVSVIFGANIGTTMTAQLMAFKISNYVYPIIFIGFLMNFIGRKEKIKNIGMVIFSFGLLFEGIEIMGKVMKPLAGSPVFINLMGKVSDIPVLGVVLGAVMTLIVQSSSATIAVLQNFASQAGPDGVTSVMGLAGAIPILLGDNIGTTITALLASIGQSKNAKRTAVAHSVFNITGSILFLFIIPVLAGFVRFISPKGNEVDVISRQIANAHTTFNVVCTLIWLPLIPVMIKIVTFIIRGQDEMKRKEYSAGFLDEKLIAQPAAALYLVSDELRHMTEYTADILEYLKESISGKEPRAAREKYSENAANAINLYDSLSVYMTRMFSSGNLTEIQSEQTAGMFYLANHVERIAGRCGEIAESCDRLEAEGKKMSQEARKEIRTCMKITQKMFREAVNQKGQEKSDIVRNMAKERNKLRKVSRQYSKEVLNRVKKKKCDAAVLKYYEGIIYNIGKIADNCIGIAEETMGHALFPIFFR